MSDYLNAIDRGEGLTLVLGGTGKCGRRIAQRLERRGIPMRVASRKAVPSFDWGEPGNWDAVLAGVAAAYISYAPDLAIPGATDTMRAFVKRAVVCGVKRLVLLSGRGEDGARRAERVLEEGSRRSDEGRSGEEE